VHVRIEMNKANHNRLIVILPYSEERIAKIRKIQGRKWHKDKKVWTIPADEKTIKKFKILFSNESIEYSELGKYKNLFKDSLSNEEVKFNENKRDACTLNKLNNENRELITKLAKNIILKGYSRETCKSYTSNITHFMFFSKLNIISSELIELYIMYLLKEKKCKINTINQIISSIIFFVSIFWKITLSLNQLNY